MRYVVLLRYGLGQLVSVLTVERTADGSVSCAEMARPFAGMTWLPDGCTSQTTADGKQHTSQGTPLTEIHQPEVAYSIPGPALLDPRLPAYSSDVDRGATVQICAHAVAEEPEHVALQLVLVGRAQEPLHRETVGDRRIDEGQPDLWIVLARSGDDILDRAVLAPYPHTLPPLAAAVVPPRDS